MFLLKLRPAEHFFFGMWPSDKFEFETPDINYIEMCLPSFRHKSKFVIPDVLRRTTGEWRVSIIDKRKHLEIVNRDT